MKSLRATLIRRTRRERKRSPAPLVASLRTRLPPCLRKHAEAAHLSSVTTRSLYRQKGHSWLSSRTEYDDLKKCEAKMSKGKSVYWIKPTRNNLRSSRPFFPDDGSDDKYSNTIELYDAIPKYVTNPK